MCSIGHLCTMKAFCILILSFPREEAFQRSTNCLTDPAALFEEQLPLKAGHANQALTQVPGSVSHAVSGRHALETLPASPCFSSIQLIHFYEINTNQRRSGNTSSEIHRRLCLYSDYTETCLNVCAALIIFLKPTL